MTGRNKEEMEGVTLLGNQGTKYPQDYAPEVLETFVNIRITIILLSSIVRSLHPCVRLPDNRILQPFIFPMYRERLW